MKILLTGGTGFVGSSLVKLLLEKGYFVTAAVRKSSRNLSSRIEQVTTGDIQKSTDWTGALENIDVVIHLAARVHILSDVEDNALEIFRLENTESTLNLARQSSNAGVGRFIFLSSIKVNGEETEVGKRFKFDDKYIPTDPYGLSKFEAEEGLKCIAKQTSMEVVIIRPPLVYGEGVKANFLSMIRFVYRGSPLPLALIENKRSLVSIDNLTNLIEICINHPNAANETFLVSDDEDLSTPELLIRLGAALGKPPRLFPFPQKWLSIILFVLGQGSISKRLIGSLQVDVEKTKSMLGWRPPVSVDQALAKTATAWLSKNK